MAKGGSKQEKLAPHETKNISREAPVEGACNFT